MENPVKLEKITRPGRIVLATAALLLLPLAASTAFAQESDEVRIVKKKVQVHCDEGDDCAEGLHEIIVDAGAGDHRVVFIGDDGETKVLEGDSNVWVSEHGAHTFEMAFGGGFLGVELTELSDDLRVHFGVPTGQGVMVAKVVDDSPAFRAGLEAGDIITGVGGQAVQSAAGLGKLVRAYEDGQVADLELWRDGSLLQLSAQIEARKSSPNHFAFRTGSPAHSSAKVVIVCDDDDEDCAERPHHQFFSNLDCDGGECEIQVECENGDCVCTVNGEEQPCE